MSDTNLNTLVILLVGILSFLVYFLKLRNSKKEAASILLMEIRQAEKTLELIVNHPLDLDVILTVLPTNNWKTYAHLFVKDFDQDQIDEIYAFYSNCESIDRALKQIASEKQIHFKTEAVFNMLFKIAYDCKDDKEKFEKSRKYFLEIAEKDATIFIPNAPIEAIRKCASKTRKISTTPLGLKLKNVSKRCF